MKQRRHADSKRRGRAQTRRDAQERVGKQVIENSRVRNIHRRFDEVWPTHLWDDCVVIVALSGGADSVALARITQSQLLCAQAQRAVCAKTQRAVCAKTQRADSSAVIADAGRPPVGATTRPLGRIVLAHFDHGVRDGSAADRRWVESFAAQRGLELLSQRATDIARGGNEAALAAARYRFLIDAARRVGARCVFTGHHRDDQVETLLHHLMRGSGPAGLSGMPLLRTLRSDLLLVRPLLPFHRSEIREYLAEIGQEFRDDPTNAGTDPTRNWIRHDLLPLMRQRFPNVDVAISQAAASLHQWRECLDAYAADWLRDQLGDAASLENLKRSPENIERFECGEPVETKPGRDGPARERHLRTDSVTHRAIQIAGLQMLWDASAWPRQAMTAAHWNRLVDAIGDSTHPA
ncbi:MAG: tRNA lysidine(34) synthetase TilS, partial [Planctomycetota bacterium]